MIKKTQIVIKKSDSDSHCISWQVPKGSVQGEIMNDDDDGDDQSEIIMMIIMIMMGTLGLLNWQNCLKKLPGKANAWSFLKTAEHCLDLIFWKRPTLSFPPQFWQITYEEQKMTEKYKMSMKWCTPKIFNMIPVFFYSYLMILQNQCHLVVMIKLNKWKTAKHCKIAKYCEIASISKLFKLCWSALSVSCADIILCYSGKAKYT